MELITKSLETNLPMFAGLAPKVVLANVSSPYSNNCQIDAQNDLEAINCWLNQYRANQHTFLSYSREAKRLLLWCIYEQGCSLNQLKAQDFENYFTFLKNPPIHWCTTKAELRVGNAEPTWRLFLGPLKQTAFNMAVRVINSLLNYLVEADYLRTNPLKLIKKRTNFSLDFTEHKYKVWQRMLEVDEWEAMQRALNNMPEKTKIEIDNKLRTQFLFALLYLLGLRIHEVVNATWGSFRKIDNNWWFFIKGKGGKLGHIPVNEQLLSFIKIYRLHLGKTSLPAVDETENLFISTKTKKPLQQGQLYNLVKAIGLIASQEFKHNQTKKEKLEKLSPHWLRHLSASHQDKLGIPATVIQANHRHSSIQTTQIYLHAEDEFRSQEMQKMQMQVMPKTIATVDQPDIAELIITLKGSSISEIFNLEKLLDSIENNIFKDVNWQLKGEDKNTILSRYKQLYIYKQPLIIAYLLRQIMSAELSIIKKLIIQEADIRLFNCSVSIIQ